MDWNEFHDVWLRKHLAKFPGIVAWLAKFPVARGPKEADGLVPTRREILDQWHSTLQRFTLDAALAATNELGADGMAPKGFGDHPIAIAAICRGRKRSDPGQRPGPRLRPDGTETFRCRLCHDWGLVTLYHPSAISWAKGTLPADKPWRYTMTARCSCNDDHHRDLTQYDPHEHLLAGVSPFSGEGLEALARFVSIERRMADAEWTPDSAFQGAR